MSLEHLVEVLGIASADANTENGAENAGNDAENGDDFVREVLGVDASDENSTAYEEDIKLNEVEVSEATKKFVADVESVEFSNPELVWVSKVDVESTVGELKEANGLDVKYSAELTEEQIAEINNSTVESGEWALISVQPFKSEETLTVTMNNGNQFVVKVTDAQISTHVITADGEDYIITVTYGPEAGIPDDATLKAEEIPSGTEEYDHYVETSKYRMELETDCSIEIKYARFFDITILNPEGEEIEPKAPVAVSIQYANGLEIVNETDEASVVHFAEDGPEILDVNTRLEGSDNSDSEINVFEYIQDSFSVSGTIINSTSIATGKYFIVTEKNGKYYALTNSGSAVEVTYNSQYDEYVFSDDNVAASALWDVNRLYGTYYNVTTQDGEHGLQLLGHTDTPDRLIGYPMSLNITRSSGNQFHIREDDWNATLVFRDNNQFGSDYYEYTSEFHDQYWGPWYVGTTEVITWENCADVRFAKYSVDNGAGTPSDAGNSPYTGKEIDPSELNSWLEDFWNDELIDVDACSKTAEVFDYENRIYQIELTAQSKVRALLNNLDLAFSFDFSNSMLVPTTLTSIENVDLTQKFLNKMVEKGQLSTDKVYFVISDVTQTATVNALYYNDSSSKWQYLDALKYARHQSGNNVSNSDTKTKISTATGATDNGSYILYEAP